MCSVDADDCRPCRCPGSSVLGDINVFSATCNDTQCHNCSLGHTGPRCDICLEGFYGTPNNASVYDIRSISMTQHALLLPLRPFGQAPSFELPKIAKSAPNLKGLRVTVFTVLHGFYRASICEGGLGSRNSVCPSIRPSVCHTRRL